MLKTHLNYAEILEVQKNFLYSFLQDSGFKKILVPFSAGIDSALCLSIIKLALKDDMKLVALFMPSTYTHPLSYELAQVMCLKNHIPLEVFPIKFLHSTLKNQYKDHFREELSGLADENVQPRLRAIIGMAYANSHHFLVANCSNKSELLTGYSTLYGDSVGAFSLLGDLYKSQVYEFAHYLNQKYPETIDPRIIERSPSAELKKDQKDTDSLPPYTELDPILELLCKGDFSLRKILTLNPHLNAHTKELLDKVLKLYKISAYKRDQFCPICKMRPQTPS